jgi:hypothetical protein
MTIDEKVLQKEKTVREQLELLRANLNSNRIVYNNNKNDWTYLAALGHTEIKLNEILDFFKTGV